VIASRLPTATDTLDTWLKPPIFTGYAMRAMPADIYSSFHASMLLHEPALFSLFSRFLRFRRFLIDAFADRPPIDIYAIRHSIATEDIFSPLPPR
jgi:hypothetical protein